MQVTGAASSVVRALPPHRERWLPIVVVLAVLAALKMGTAWLGVTGAVLGVVATAAVVAVATHRGRTSWHDLGLSAHALKRGLIWAAVMFALFAAGFAVFAAATATLPVLAAWVSDLNVTAPSQTVLLQALVTIPLGTVLVEEVAFRGALPALLGRAGAGTRTAILGSAVLFGLWHVAPSLTEALRATGSAGAVVAAVLGTVAFTTASGVGLGWLRHRSRSLLPPMMVHLATNSLGLGLLWFVTT